MPGEWNRPLLAAVTADVVAANLRRTDNGQPILWGPVAQLMLLLANIEAKPDDWRKRHARIKADEAALLSSEFDRATDYRERLSVVLAEYQAGAAETPTDETGAQLAAEGVEFPDLKQRAEPGWGLSFLEQIAAVQDTMKALDTQQNIARAVLKTNLPVGVVFPGDFHLGGRGTNHRLMVQDMLMWKALGDAVKVAGMGDYSEQFVGKLARIGLSQHVMTKDMQIDTVKDVFCNTLLGQWLVFLEGNHDGWAGDELARYVMHMAQRCGVPFLGKGGELFLTVGRVEYKLALWHRYPGASALNKGNNQRRVRIDHNGADVVALAHLHNAYVEFGQTGEVNHVGLRCGAYKTTDEHSRDAAGNVIADTRMPMVIFNPAEKDMLYYEDYRKGVETLLRLRREWKQHPSFKTDPGRLSALLGA